MLRFSPSLLLYAIPLAGLIVISCGHDRNPHGHDAHDILEKSVSHHDHDDNEIIISPEDARRYGVRAEAVVKAPFSEVVKVVGEILPASTDRVVVSSPVSGIVRLSPGIEVGKNVHVGESVATISSQDVAGGDANRVAKATLDAAKRELDRVTPLLKDKLVTKKEYNEALQAYEEAKNAYSPGAASRRATASIAGVISELIVNDGSFVEAGQPIATVVRNQRLTLKALLPLKYADMLPHITSANIQPCNGSQQVIRLSDRNGKLLSAETLSGANTPGYTPVIFTFDYKGDLIPGTPVEVYLIGSDKSDKLTVPIASISEQQGNKFVYVKVEGHAYVKHPVKVGRDDGERITILDGISEGDSVVSVGTTFVRLAETSTVVPEGHSHSH